MKHIGEAIIDVMLDNARDGRTSRVRRVFEWLAKATKPPVGVRLVCDDGGQFTGFLIVDENRPIAMLALRVGSSPARPPPHERQYMRPMFDEPSWRDDVERYP